MKKLVSVVLAMLMILSMSTFAFAENKMEVKDNIHGVLEVVDYETGTYKVTVADKNANCGMGSILVDEKDAWYNYGEVGYVVLIDDWYGYIYIDSTTDYQYDLRNVVLEKISDEDLGLSYQYVPVWPFENDYTSPECFA